MRVGIFTNLNKDIDLAITKSVVEILSCEKQIDIFLHDKLAKQLELDFEQFNEHSDLGFDMIVAIGGDGTILRIAKFCAKTKTPIIGVNLGRLGFLTDIEPKEIKSLLDLLINKRYSIESRDLLEVQINKKSYLSLNEAAFVRNGTGLLSLAVSINDVYLDSFNCDGFIVATSVGSTAYSLSAGGPILSPNSESFVLTPINSHSLYTRPIVIGNKENVCIELKYSSDSADVVIDGVKSCKICQNETVKIQKSIHSIEFARPLNYNFYSKIFSKFGKF